MITFQNYVKAQSLEEAYTLNQKKSACIIAGMLWTKMTTRTVNPAIDLSGLGLDTIEETEEAFSIGAMVTLRQLEQHAGLNAYTGNAVRDAVKDIVGVQFRNLATIGGSIWGRFGFSDVLTVFLSMDTCVELYKGGIIPLKEFAEMKYDRDLLVRVIVKKTPGIFVYSSMRNQSTDFPVIACAVSRVDGEYRLVIGARPMKAKLVLDENSILSRELTEEEIAKFSEWAAENIPTSSNSRAGAAYRSRLINVLTQRSLQRIKEVQ